MKGTFRTHQFQKAWLIVTAVVVGSFGPVFALATRQHNSGMAKWTLDLLNGPGGPAESFASGTTRFLSALTGGFLLGWGVTILLLRAWVYDLAPEPVRRSVVVGLIAWFILDSSGSIASGRPWNVLYNVIVLVTAIGPLCLPVEVQA